MITLNVAQIISLLGAIGVIVGIVTGVVNMYCNAQRNKREVVARNERELEKQEKKKAENLKEARQKEEAQKEIIDQIKGIGNEMTNMKIELTSRIEQSDDRTKNQIEGIKKDFEIQILGVKEQVNTIKTQFDDFRKESAKSEREKSKLTERMAKAEASAEYANKRISDIVALIPNKGGVIVNERETDK